VLAVQEETVAVIIVAIIGAAASLLNTVLLRRQKREVTPTNGTTLAGLVQATADKLFQVDTNVDRLNVQVTELNAKLEAHLAEHQAEAEPPTEDQRHRFPQEGGER